MSTPQIRKLSKGVSKIVLKFSHEIIFRTRNYGTPSLAFLSPGKSSWLSTIDVVPCHKSRRPHSINSFPASQVEAVEVEIFLSGQGSRKVNMEKSSIAFSSRSVSITFESSEVSKEVPPGSIEAFYKLLFVAITYVECCTLSILVFIPITVNSLDR
jgi:hypothetical protein